jgi:hypothetical protein
VIIDILGDATGKEVSVIKDPFKKDGLSGISIQYITWALKPYWWAKVEFKNGNTSGDQRTPNCDTFEEVIIALKQILNSVENK